MVRGVFAAMLTIMVSFQLLGQISDFSDVNFSKADSVARAYDGHKLNDLRDLSWKLTSSLSTDVEKFRAIYTWVCENIESDHQLYLENRSQRLSLTNAAAYRAWSKKFHAKAFQMLMRDKRTVCTGYAHIVRELSLFVDIQCKIIDGYGRTLDAVKSPQPFPNHSWTAVHLRGKWYLCDATWSSGAFDKTAYTFIKRYDPSYFLADPALFVRNHYPLDTAWLLTDHRPDLQQFFEAPIVYVNAFRYQVYPQYPLLLNTTVAKGEKVSFQFDTRGTSQIKDVTLMIGRVRANDRAVCEVVNANTSRYTIDHTFRSRGSYDVHLLVDGTHTLSYTVQVR